MNQRRVDLAQELDRETKRRQEIEELHEQLKEQLVRFELAESRKQAELQTRIETQEQEKQALNLQILRLTEGLSKGENFSRDKIIGYESTLSNY